MIHTNKRHPFLTVEKGFVTVGQLRVGMHVVRASDGVGVVSGWKFVPGVMTMYNLEVAQDHTFTVGAGQWVVHNCGEGGDIFSAANTPEDRSPSGSLKSVDNKYLQRNGIDAHALKGDNGLIPVSQYDIYKDREGYLFGLRKGGNPDAAVYLWHNVKWGGYP